MSVREYIGARYVPVFADPIEWDGTLSYEPLTVVKYQGASYVSRQWVPEGIQLDNAQYWILWADYNAQLEAYRQEVLAFDGRITANADEIAELVDEIAAIKAANWVTSVRIADSAVTTGKIADNAVATGKIADEAVTGAKIADGSIDSGHLAEDSVTAFAIAPSSVGSAEIINESIQTIDLADNSVSHAKLTDEAVQRNNNGTNLLIAIGDSYSTNSYVDGAVVTSGNELLNNIKTETGLYFRSFAVGGAGFVNTAYTAQTFIRQLQDAIADNTIDVNKVKAVLIFGGTNDWYSQDLGDIQQAIRDIQAVYAGSRFAKIPLIIAFNKGSYTSNYSQKVMSCIFAGMINSSKINVTYVNLTGALAGYDCIAGDGVHPNTYGYNVLSKYLANVIMGMPSQFVHGFLSPWQSPTMFTLQKSSIFIKDSILHFNAVVRANIGELATGATPLFSLKNCASALNTAAINWNWSSGTTKRIAEQETQGGFGVTLSTDGNNLIVNAQQGGFAANFAAVRDFNISFEAAL